MRLRKLDIYGFKSFADRTDFHFEPGLTAIIGPNGCGKSNVVDAIRWVLGEQSAKSLRGNEMLDVIFGGTSSRKPLGYAEVAISIDNSSRRLPIDYDEVCIARRLYRSGESEYFINKQACRLKDIREMIMDTGIGMDAYSVIEQGKVDMLLQANAQDRRAIFEEAAGISKYKAKKKAALSKLERVDQDLLRVNDILQEVQKQIRSIERQASKARRFKDLSEELRSKQIALLLHEYHDVVGRASALSAETDVAAQRRDLLSATAQRLDGDLTQRETEQLALEQKLGQLQAADSDTQAQISGAEATISISQERLRELDVAEGRCKAEIEQAAARIAEIRQELERIAGEVAAVEQEIAERQTALGSKQEEARLAYDQAADLTRRLDHERLSIMNVLQKRTDLQNDITKLAGSQRVLSNDRQRLETRTRILGEELAQLASRRQELEFAVERLRSAMETRRGDLARCHEERGRLDAELQALTNQIHDLRVMLKSKESRHDLLADLEAKFEGLDIGVKALIEESRREGTSLPGIRGLVADLIDVDLEHASAIESLLGDRVQAVVVNSVADAQTSMVYLRENKKGRVSFIPLDLLTLHPVAEAEPIAHEGILSRARDVVRVPDDAATVANVLLRNATIVRDVDTGLQLAAMGNGTPRSYVTPRGELVRSDGFIFGGNGQERLGVISRRSELKALESEMAQLAAQTDSLEEQRTRLAARLSELAQQITDNQVALAQDEMTSARQSDELKRVMADIVGREDELEVSRSEMADIDKHLTELHQRESALQAEADTLSAGEQEIKKSIASIDQQRSALLQRKVALDEAITELKVTLAQRHERCGSLKSSADQLDRSVRDQQALIARTEAEIRESADRRELAVRTISEKEQELQALVLKRDSLRSEIGRLDSERNVLREELEASKGQNRDLHAEIQKLDEQIQDRRLRLNELQYELRTLEDRSRAECEANLAELHTGYQDAEADWTAFRSEIDEIRKKRDAIGPVNLLAIEELAQLEERERFLSTQYQDISGAKQSLQEAIRKINHQSRKMFQATFDAVRANFQVLFRKLFAGGKADVMMEEDKDILEAGIEIIARPPGKEPRSITLLSGGEKVLTATALLFAIFQAKPSPFCVLDEVDAALDEANVGRFVLMLREFLQHSQFIVITHSKRTMSLADALYGVTMQEPGVSKKVSVRFTSTEGGEHVAQETVEEDAVVVQ